MAETARTLTFPLATRMDFRVDVFEDRVILTAHTMEHGLRDAMLTRRMAAIILDRYAAEMERSSPTATRATPDNKGEVLRMEHSGALERAPLTAGPAQAAPPAEAKTSTAPPQTATAPSEPAKGIWLVTETKLKVEEKSVLLGFLGFPLGAPREGGPDPVCIMTLSREDAHRVLGALTAKVLEADWNLPKVPAWLRGDAPPPRRRGVH